LEGKVKNDRNKSIFFIASGYYHLSLLKYERARVNFLNVIEIGKQSSTPKRMINGYQGLIDVNKAQGHWEEAFRYRDSMGVAIVEMNVSNQIKHINDLESKYQAQLKQEEIKRLNIEKELQKQEIKKKNGMILFSIGGLLLSLLAIFGFYRANRIKTESNQLLTDKNTELESALVTNKMLVKEIHHRVKNNLQVVSSLLNLQSRFEKEESILEAINSGKNRVQTMSLLHQNLYGNEDLKIIKVQKYFRELAESLTDGYPLGGQKVDLKTEIDDIEMDVEKVIPLGLIANELITNALKYAYVKSMENCELLLVLKQAGDEVELRVSDNGVGIPFDTIPSRPKSMGMQLIHSFSRKLKAKIHIDNQNGTEFILRFNVS
jgi:two-component sensor histidine kinase